jgi:hypothetical protein
MSGEASAPARTDTARCPDGDSAETGQFLDCPHGLCVDPAGSIYVTEVPDTPDRVIKFERL